MASLQVFRDLPQIPYHDDYVHTYNDNWSGYTDNYVSYRSSNMQRFLEGPNSTPILPIAVHEHQQVWGRALPVQSRNDSKNTNAYEAPYPCPELLNRNYTPAPSQASGSSWNNTDDSPTKHRYCASPKSPSPSPSHQGYDYHTISTFSQSTHLTGGSCIALSQVQQIPDASDDYNPEPWDTEDIRPHHMSIDGHFDADVKRHASDYEMEDEGLGESIRDSISAEPPEKMEEDDDQSDYEPATQSRKKRRTSQSSTKSSGSPTSRKSGRKSSPAKATKVVKPSTKSNGRKKTKGQKGTSCHCASEDDTSSQERPFPCTLSPYGCKSSFGSKNEWKRHISTQHVRLGFWRCTACPDLTTHPNDFNRKDLFIQHCRRMHIPKNGVTVAKPVVTEETLTAFADRCYHELRKAPALSACIFCDRTFQGSDAWDERLEHVGRHMDDDRKKSVGPRPIAQWQQDQDLEKWLLLQGLLKRNKDGWEIATGEKGGSHVHDADADADGEEEN